MTKVPIRLSKLYQMRKILDLISYITERIKKRRVNSFDDLHRSVMRDSKNIHMGRKNNHSLINS